MDEKPPRKPYTMSEKALAQRRAASPAGALASTGPVTDEGKAASSRNGWKHGRYSAVNRAHFGLGANHVAKLFGKPCVKTCPFHPENPERTEAPCSLVLDGLTHAGGSCLDKTVYVRALDSIMQVMEDGNMEGMHGVLAVELASNLQLLQHIRQQVAELGVVVPVYATDKEGNPVLLDGKPIIADMKANPILAHLIKLNESLGINFAEVLATPRARQKVQDEDNATDALQNIFGAIVGRAAKRIPRTLDGDES